MEHGLPISSAELRRATEEAEAAGRDLAHHAARLERRLAMVSLALQASAPDIVPANALRLSAAAGCSQEGPAVVTSRASYAASLNPYGGELAWRGLSGTGELELLEEGAVWAALSDARDATFSCRLEPAFLTRFNEVVVPVVSGPVLARLGRSDGGWTECYAERTTVFRFAELKEFNGHIEVASTSVAGYKDRWIHACGALRVGRAEWADEGEAHARLMPEQSGTLAIDAVGFPDGQAASFTVWAGGIVQAPQSVAAVAGQPVEIRVNIPWGRSASHIIVESRWS